MRTIDINTTQNVTIQYELANLRDRILSFMIDFVILAISSWILLIAVASTFSMKFGNVYLYLIIMPYFLFYTLAQEVMFNGQTIGKRVLGLRVVKINGKEPTISDYLIRWAFRLVDIWFSSGSLAALLISSTPRNQRLGGLLSDTTVVRLNSSSRFKLDDILKINSIDNYEPSYPEIRFFSEEDMLTIKTALDRFRQYPNPAHQEVIEELSTTLAKKLEVAVVPANRVAFLKTLVSDYIVLTR